MKSILAIVVVAAAVIAFLTWRTHDLAQLRDDPPLQFRQVTDEPLPDVIHCILEGNGSKAFAAFEQFARHSSYPVGSTLLVDDQGSRLFIGLRGLETVVSYRSAEPPADRQLDLLHWCTSRPKELWLPKHLRT